MTATLLYSDLNDITPSGDIIYTLLGQSLSTLDHPLLPLQATPSGKSPFTKIRKFRSAIDNDIQPSFSVKDGTSSLHPPNRLFLYYSTCTFIVYNIFLVSLLLERSAGIPC